MVVLSPSLKLKIGEMQALLQSERNVSANVVPIFDVVRPTKKTPVLKRVEDSANLLIAGGWCKPSKPFFVDTYDIPPEQMLPDELSPIEGLAKRLALYNYRPTYCYGFDRGPVYEQGFARLVQANLVQTFALRLERHDLVLLDETIDRIRLFLGQIQRSFQDISVILDLRSLDESATDSTRICEVACRRFEKLGVPTQIFLASAMWDWSRLKTEKVNRVPRADFALWMALRRLRLPLRFGDYGVICPEFSEPDGKSIIPAPKLRYCTTSLWLVAKGEKPRKGENNQYPRLARRLMKEREFRHNELNWGHDELRNLENYRFESMGHHRAVAIDTCNHLDLVFRQVASTERLLAESQETTSS
jgi:hypothetical protein